EDGATHTLRRGPAADFLARTGKPSEELRFPVPPPDGGWPVGFHTLRVTLAGDVELTEASAAFHVLGADVVAEEAVICRDLTADEIPVDEMTTVPPDIPTLCCWVRFDLLPVGTEVTGQVFGPDGRPGSPVAAARTREEYGVVAAFRWNNRRLKLGRHVVRIRADGRPAGECPFTVANPPPPLVTFED